MRDANLDLIDAAAGGDVSRAGGPVTIELISGETDEKGHIRRTGAGGLARVVGGSRAGRAAQQELSRVSTYVDGEAGGREAAGRGVGEQGRGDGRLPQAPRRQRRRSHAFRPLPQRRDRRLVLPVCWRPSVPRRTELGRAAVPGGLEIAGERVGGGGWMTLPSDHG
jgi:hypothetical protein